MPLSPRARKSLPPRLAGPPRFRRCLFIIDVRWSAYKAKVGSTSRVTNYLDTMKLSSSGCPARSPDQGGEQQQPPGGEEQRGEPQLREQPRERERERVQRDGGEHRKAHHPPGELRLGAFLQPGDVHYAEEAGSAPDPERQRCRCWQVRDEGDRRHDHAERRR